MTREKTAQVAGFLGLCTRAGQVCFGQDACVDAVRRRGVGLVLVDTDSSANTMKRFTDACTAHGVPLYGLEADIIARAVGKEGRKVAGVRPGGMAQKLLSLLEGEPRLAPAQAPDSE